MVAGVRSTEQSAFIYGGAIQKSVGKLHKGACPQKAKELLQYVEGKRRITNEDRNIGKYKREKKH